MNTRQEYLQGGGASGSIRATDRLMRELQDIYRSQNFKDGACVCVWEEDVRCYLCETMGRSRIKLVQLLAPWYLTLPVTAAAVFSCLRHVHSGAY